MVTVEIVTAAESATDSFRGQVHQKLEQVAGVSRVLPDEGKDGKVRFKVESLQGRQIRPDLAKAVIESGWNLNELRPVGLSLEEIFLELTATPEAAPTPSVPAAEAQPEPAAAPAEGTSGEAQ